MPGYINDADLVGSNVPSYWALRLFGNYCRTTLCGRSDGAGTISCDCPDFAHCPVLRQRPEILVLSVQVFHDTVSQKAALYSTTGKFMWTAHSVHPRFSVL